MNSRSPRRLRNTRISLAHGGGGRMMRDLIETVFVSTFENARLAPLEDQARFGLDDLRQWGNRLALSTDSYVVDPLFFPGGDIGRLAVAGTVNDLAVGGAKPLYLSCAMIIEEGLAVDTLQRIVDSMQQTAIEAGVQIVTGDTKVVPRGMADKLFINTTGIGVIRAGIDIGVAHAIPGDQIVINGFVGDHGAAIVDARGELSLQYSIESDCQPLNSLIEAMLDVCPQIHCMRDATRGGIATVLNEFASASEVGICIDESALPIRDEVRAIGEILGLDPLYLANEGKLIAVVPAEKTPALLAAMRAHPQGHDSAVIGEVSGEHKKTVVLATTFGGERIVDMLAGDQLPRIC